MQINVNMRHLTLEVKQLHTHTHKHRQQATSATWQVLHMQHTKKANQSCLLQLVKFKQKQQQQMMRFANVLQRRVAASVALNEGRPRQRSASHRTLSNALSSAMHDVEQQQQKRQQQQQQRKQQQNEIVTRIT